MPAGGSQCIGRIINGICDFGFLHMSLCIRALKEKRLELSTPNLVDIQCMAVARRALALRSKVMQL